MKATWHDIEVALNTDTLEEKDKATLQAFLRVEPPPSNNPTFHARFNDAKHRIRHRLLEIAAEEMKAARSFVATAGAADAGQWYVQVVRLAREIRKKAFDAQKTKSKAMVATLKGYLDTDHDALQALWPKQVPCPEISNLGRHIHFSQPVDFRDILNFDLPAIEAAAEKHFLAIRHATPECGFESLLHPVIRASSYAQFRSGHLREAVLNSIVGLCDYVRQITGLKSDGAKLVNEVFGGGEPALVFSELETESGRNDQSGFHKIFLGACEGVRNPKAHSLAHDLNPTKAAQYLVFASLLARRVDECKRKSKA
jgi:uncharacterized protein (TIGR02391 family)